MAELGRATRVGHQRVVRLLLRISRLAEEVREVGELDLNPVIVRREGLGCVFEEARIFVRTG